MTRSCSARQTTTTAHGGSRPLNRTIPEGVSLEVEVDSANKTITQVSRPLSLTCPVSLAKCAGGFGGSTFGQPAQQQQQSTGMFGNTTSTFGGGGGGFGQQNNSQTQNTGFGARPGFGSTGTSTFGATSESILLASLVYKVCLCAAS